MPSASFSYLSPYFSKIFDDLYECPEFFYSKWIRYLEVVFNIRIFIIGHPRIERGASFGFLLEDCSSYLILISQDDLLNKPHRARFSVGHELGHWAGRHVEELHYLVMNTLGNLNHQQDTYRQWRHIQEQEADLFAANLFYSVGPAILREVLSETDFQRLVESIRHPDDHQLKPSIMNSPTERVRIKDDLRRAGYIKPPIPILCHSLSDIFQAERINSMQRNHVPRILYDEFRRRLESGETKPSGGLCDFCEDALAEMCNEEGHPCTP
ncbi:MAG: hypothetical protein NTX50_03700 [Candidatus Sumerlaeota bacterium]|nr:hypothetical protein [Candidatus Sumerlaeota bacterium]